MRIGKNICAGLNKRFLSIYCVIIILFFMEKKLAEFIGENNLFNLDKETAYINAN